MICAYCKSRVLESDRKCQACGSAVFVLEPAPFPPQVQETAPPAGEAADAYGRAQEARYGAPYGFPGPDPFRSPRNRWVALLLCLLGGPMGFHRFYTGKIGSGILYALTGGLFGFGFAVDALLIALGRFRDSKGRLLHSDRLW